MKILGCFLILSFVLIAMPGQASDVALFGGVQHEGKLTLNNAVSNASSQIEIQNLTVGKTLNIIQVSAGAAFSF
jgi:Pleurocidin family